MVNYTYNLTSVDNVTSITDFFVNVNAETKGYPMIATVIMVFFATFIYLSSRNMSNIESFMGSSFLSMIIAGLAYFAGFFALYVPVIFFTLFIGSFLIKSFQ